jgi:glycerol-3-phosphate acyltransferase PlsX
VKIAVDAMGGDAAPRAVVEGAHRAVSEDRRELLLVGDRVVIEDELARLDPLPIPIEIVHSGEVVGMDEPAVTPLRRKRGASVRVCAELVKAERARAMVTAGNTGAAMAAAVVVMGTLEGVDRPALAAVVPTIPGGRCVLLDVGANVSTKARHLRQFAVMGHFYAQEVLGTPRPRVGLLSVGEEEGKGNELTREVYRVLESTGLNFLGNVEGHDVFNGEADVVVCDGFVGNVVLKSSEALARMILEELHDELAVSFRTRIGARLALPALARLRDRTDPDQYGAAPLLGVQGGCFIGHGSSSAEGIRNAIRAAAGFCQARVDEKIRQKVEEMHREEEALLWGEMHE